jgi:hypothetical protein
MMRVSFKWLKSSITGDELTELDVLLNERDRQGWELVSYTFMGGAGGGFGRGILIMFKKRGY